MPVILVTWETSQEFRSWLKLFALKNIWNISTTWDTFQDERSWSKRSLFLNNLDMLGIEETSHVPIGPYRPLQFPSADWSKHFSIAWESSVLLCGLKTEEVRVLPKIAIAATTIINIKPTTIVVPRVRKDIPEMHFLFLWLSKADWQSGVDTSGGRSRSFAHRPRNVVGCLVIDVHNKMIGRALQILTCSLGLERFTRATTCWWLWSWRYAHDNTACSKSEFRLHLGGIDGGVVWLQ